MQAIARKYGYDFRNYSKASIKRRIMNVLATSGLKTISEMQHKLLYDKQFFDTLLLKLSVNVTEMFRDPSFYSALRKDVIPQLKPRPFIKIWHAGCATGEEVYSMAILLKEENLYEKAWIYATDFNEKVLTATMPGGKKRTTGIERMEDVDGKLILQGAEDGVKDVRDGLGWSMANSKETGDWTLTGSGDQVGFVVFGASTPQ